MNSILSYHCIITNTLCVSTHSDSKMASLGTWTDGRVVCRKGKVLPQQRRSSCFCQERRGRAFGLQVCTYVCCIVENHHAWSCLFIFIMHILYQQWCHSLASSESYWVIRDWLSSTSLLPVFTRTHWKTSLAESGRAVDGAATRAPRGAGEHWPHQTPDIVHAGWGEKLH